MTTPATINTLADRAMLIRVTISSFKGVKTDKKITQEVAEKHGSDIHMGRYAKSLLSKEALTQIRQLECTIRHEHYRRTLPWDQDGARILTTAGYLEYAEFMRDCEAKWRVAVDDFIANWDFYVADARKRLNGAFDPNDYPQASRLRRKFEFAWDVRPVPVASDFRVNLSDNEVSAIRNQIETSLQITVDAAMQDVWTRLKDVVQKMSERLKLYDPAHATANPFRDSLVTNITDLLGLVPSLNLTNDPNVTRFAAEMERDLTRYDADVLRDSESCRLDTARRAKEILNKMEAFIA